MAAHSVWLNDAVAAPLREVQRILVTRSRDYPAADQPWGTHASGIAVLPSGDILVNWYGGTCRGENEHGACIGDPRGNTSIYTARLAPGADRFSATEVLVGRGETRYMDANFFVDGANLWAVYVRDGGVNDSPVIRAATDPHGRSWGEERAVGVVRGRVMNPPLRVADRILMPISAFDKEGPWRDVVIAGSDDSGATWNQLQRLEAPDPLVILREPCLVRVGEAEVHMYARALVFTDEWTSAPVDDPRWRCYRSVSYDHGTTWTQAAPVGVPNFDSKVSVATLRDGRLVMAFNPVAQRFLLCLAVSADKGETWQPAGTLDAGPGEMSYPTFFVDVAGDVHLSYTWKRREIMYKRFSVVG